MSAKGARRLAAGILTAVAAIGLGGCCTLGLKCKAVDAVTVSAAANLNSCDGSNHSVTVRFYSLTSTDAFNRGDFDVMWNDEGKGLGDQKPAMKEIVVGPGQAAQVIQLARPKGCVALGIVANFCTQSPGCWYKLIKLEKGSARVRVNLEKVCLTATAQD